MDSMNPKRKILALLLLLQGIFWLTLAAAYSTSRHEYIIPSLMVANALAFFIFTWNIQKRKRWIYHISVLYVAVNLILTVTDEFGALDLIILFTNIITLILLINDRDKK